MNNLTEVTGTPVDESAKEQKGKCLMCKFVLIFSFIALLLVLILVFVMRIPAVGSMSL